MEKPLLHPHLGDETLKRQPWRLSRQPGIGQRKRPRPRISAVKAEPITKSLEEEISNSVRGDRLTDRLAGLKPQQDAAGELSGSMGQLIEKMGATPIAEIEKLIGDLHAARSYLKEEGDRLQQEAARYAAGRRIMHPAAAGAPQSRVVLRLCRGPDS